MPILADSQVESKLQYWKGVGPARAKLLLRLGIRDDDTLLRYYPRDYEDRRFRFRIGNAPMGEKVALEAVVQSVAFSQSRFGLGVATAVIDDGSASVEAAWFKRLTPRYDVFATLRKELEPGKPIRLWGSIEWGPHGRQLRVLDYSMAEDSVHFGGIVPAYTVTEGLSERRLRSLVHQALTDHAERITSPSPRRLREAHGLPSASWAVRKIHFPSSLVEKEEARQALAFDELLVLETALTLVRQQVKQGEKPHRYALTRRLLTPFRQALGFSFTQAQARAIRAIFDDMQRPAPMHRLLQGDVGSGKTLVALSAMLLAAENGLQSALMAPTEILAEQHVQTFRRVLRDLPVTVTLLCGKQTSAERKTALASIASGEASIVIGTHALIEDIVRFKNLALAVIDEQHRFGVDHRRLLREKGRHVDLLVMTATPIPRTLALTLYGDLDVSTIDELPPGRAPITTRLLSEDGAYTLICQEVQKGRQAYIVYPLVNESDKVELKSAIQEAEALRRGPFSAQRVGLLHGKMKPAEKEEVMQRFRAHELDILIATTIIEVGIDVPNATVMAIQHAERFGLATLHQLRGRVGRGPHASHCVLIPGSEAGPAPRLRTFCEIADGFRLSEADLAMRGPGEVIGERQHGIPPFHAADLAKDAAIIERARQAARAVLERDPPLAQAEHAPLADALRREYEHRWALGRIG